jgi:putative polyhydroxyalkanoate system protein
MSTIDITRQHNLDHEHARGAAETLAADLSKQYDVNYQWDGDVVQFKRSGVKGYLEVRPEELQVHLELGMMLRPFRNKIESEIETQLDRLTAAS